VGIAWIPAVLVIVAAVLTVVALRNRIPKIVMMAVVGYGMAIFYVMFRAPDLALTQLLVETVSLLLLLLIFRKIPRLERTNLSVGRKQRSMRPWVAVITGLAMAGAGVADR
jgi:multisubunit Na+/H+ antiporter MnhB subunit